MFFTKCNISSSMSAPNKQAREVCWLARDIFQQCLDRHRMEGEKGVPTRCKQLRNEYELACPRQWVGNVYFVIDIIMHIMITYENHLITN